MNTRREIKALLQSSRLYKQLSNENMRTRVCVCVQRVDTGNPKPDT